MEKYRITWDERGEDKALSVMAENYADARKLWEEATGRKRLNNIIREEAWNRCSGPLNVEVK